MPAVPTITPAFIPGPRIDGVSGNPAAETLIAGGLGIAAAGLAYAAVTATGLGIIAVGGVPLAVGATAAGAVLSVGVFLEGLQQFQRWGLINYRPQPIVNIIGANDTFDTELTANTYLRVKYRNVTTRYNVTSCASSFNFGTIPVSNEVLQTAYFLGTKIKIGNLTRTDTAFCATSGGMNGVRTPVFTAVKADGTEEVITSAVGGESIATTNQSWTQVEELSVIEIISNGVATVPQVSTPQEFAPDTRYRFETPTAADLQALGPAPLVTPLETPVLPPPPDRRPLAPPVTIPRPGQEPARVPALVPTTTPRPSPGPSPVPAQPAPRPVPAVGPLPLQLPIPFPTTPADAVLVAGQLLGGPAQAPQPNLTAIAAEVGRIEAKAQLSLTFESNTQALTSELGDLLQELEVLIRERTNPLFSISTGGEYQLAHACPPPGGGEQLPPVVVPIAPSLDPLLALALRLDAIAGLIQAHKSMGQPTCKTAVWGDPVTVQFENDL